MMLMALDLATVTGWAAGEHTDTPLFGSYRLPKTGEEIGTFLVAFEEWLTSQIYLRRPDRVVFEAPLFLGNRRRPDGKPSSNIITARKLMGLANHTEYVCAKMHVECRQQDLSRVKKFWAGNGFAEKSEMVATAKRYGFAVTDDNQADAIALWCQHVHHLFADQRHRWSLPGGIAA